MVSPGPFPAEEPPMITAALLALVVAPPLLERVLTEHGYTR
jgi:hypothetical protein